MDHIASVPMWVVLIAGVVTGAIDVWKYKVYNVVTLPLLISGLAYHTATGGWSGFGTSAAGAAAGLAIFLVPFCLGGLGGGDVKLLSGVGAWLGLTPTFFYVVIASSLAAGAYSLFLIAVHGELRRTIVNLKIVFYQIRAIASHLGPEEEAASVVACAERGQRIFPFAVMVTVGIIAVVVGHWVR